MQKVKYFQLLNFIIAGLLLFTIVSPSNAANSLIADPNLEQLIKEKIGKDENGNYKELTKELLEEVDELYSYGRGIKSLEGLEHAKNLESVSLGDSLISDISPLYNLENLHTINLDHNKLTKIDYLPNLNGTFVNIGLSNNQITTFNAPANIEADYASINLAYNQLTNIDALPNINAEYLEISLEENQITNITGLANMKAESVVSIILANNQISNIDPLSTITVKGVETPTGTVAGSVYFDLRSNQLKSVDALKNIKEMNKLFASHNEISSISALKNLPELTVVDLGHNKLKSLDGFNAALEDYNYVLDFNDNEITDISQLSKVKYGKINLKNNRISDITALKNMRGGFVDLSGNPLNSASESIINELFEKGVKVKADGIIKRIVNRVSGNTRYDTAVEISKLRLQTAKTVVIARGDDFPDALAGAPLAYSKGAPILLTRTEGLSNETIAEIKRLKAKNAIILGGTVAISAQVEKDLKGLGLTTERIAGENRFETAKLIAEKIDVNSDTAIVAYGFDFPDALAAASYAAGRYPILLTRSDSIPEETKAALKDKKKTIVVGGEAVVSKGVFQQLPGAKRIGGKNRYETAANLSNEFDHRKDKAFVANGKGFADALTGAVLAASQFAPLLLVETDWVPAETMNTLVQNETDEVLILGGPSAVSENVTNILRNY